MNKTIMIFLGMILFVSLAHAQSCLPCKTDVNGANAAPGSGAAGGAGLAGAAGLPGCPGCPGGKGGNGDGVGAGGAGGVGGAGGAGKDGGPGGNGGSSGKDAGAGVLVTGAVGQIKNIFAQTKQGFICGDPSLSKPYKRGSVGFNALTFILYLCVGPFFVTIVELAIHRRKTVRNCMITSIRCLMWIQQYFFVYILCDSTVLFIKRIGGLQRPHFFARCIPDLALNCTNGEFISDFICTNPDLSANGIIDLYVSFPSGNTVLAAYPMVFIIWYLRNRLSKIPLLVPILAIIVTWWVLLASITRITDNMHHVMDVIGAYIIVSPYVVYLCFNACKNFKTSSKLVLNNFKCLGIIECNMCKKKTIDNEG